MSAFEGRASTGTTCSVLKHIPIPPNHFRPYPEQSIKSLVKRQTRDFLMSYKVKHSQYIRHRPSSDVNCIFW